ncbi:short-chain dehydrogenase [Acinetobacter proteolyticus]|jgi:short-subunit dehydrogenase|uniref:Short-chain dehydrogenase n=1 Tax=Acinetobacter proteolyticus TaxID=1776741 RepID=A0A653K9B0_9GAMM|nr:SDR family NAD(P)-dependent oxidoreductase [Acinetobacter proteolyticus]OEY92931.1 short-chain dehydrogenase [Acinetobacter proteolyticus]PKF33758.1 short-chain dehydrogenase [Acinetobacter proteolyticus]VXA57481.1 Short-chain dehydrogenase [Acinetobacter proteolyticus]
MAKYNLKDKVVVITGSTGGLGSAVAKALSLKGAKLALLDLNAELTEQQANALGGSKLAAGWSVDVRSLASLEQAMRHVVEHFGKIDVVIANAGIGSPESLQHMAPETFERTVDINLVGVFRTFRAAIPYVKQTQGYLLAISSMAAFVHSPLNTHYTSSKAGVWALCDSLRLELKADNIGVGSFHPTFFQTPLMDAVQANPAGKAVWNGNTGIWKYVPIETVVADLVTGIEQRKSLIIVPKNNKLVALAPGLLRQLVEWIGFNRKGLEQTMQLSERKKE